MPEPTNMHLSDLQQQGAKLTDKLLGCDSPLCSRVAMLPTAALSQYLSWQGHYAALVLRDAGFLRWATLKFPQNCSAVQASPCPLILPSPTPSSTGSRPVPRPVASAVLQLPVNFPSQVFSSTNFLHISPCLGFCFVEDRTQCTLILPIL